MRVPILILAITCGGCHWLLPHSPGQSTQDGPRAESVRADGPRSDGPRSDGPRSDGPRSDAPRHDAPRFDAPRLDVPRLDAPRLDAPRLDAPRPEGLPLDLRPPDASREAKVEGGAPYPPRAIAPLTGSTVTTASPFLTWMPVTGWTTEVEICSVPTCASKVQYFTGLGGSGVQASNLAQGKTYFWRLRAGASGPWSKPWSFRVPQQPTAGIAKQPTAWGNIADLDGDGRADLLVGARDSGHVIICRHPAAGSLGCGAPLKGSYQSFGEQVSATDVNGDGLSDLIVGAPAATAVTVYLTNPTTGAPGLPSTITGKPGSGFGILAGAGDVDRDGYGDLVVGAPTEPVGTSDYGVVRLYRGGLTGIDTVSPVEIVSPGVPEQFGFSVAGAGDLNGDGYADVAVGTYSKDQVFVYMGGTDGIKATRTFAIPAPAGGQFGWSVAGAGDVNGDGYADLLIGAIDAFGHAGRAYVYHGTPAGAPQLVTTLQGSGTNEGFGHTVSGAGDVNGDGYADVLVGVAIDASSTGQRRAYLFAGSSLGVQTTPVLFPSSMEASFGRVAGVGDLNGDGLPDLTIAAPEMTRANGTGQVWLHQGVKASWPTSSVTLTAPATNGFGFTVGQTY